MLDLQGKHLLSLVDYDKEMIMQLFDTTLRLKELEDKEILFQPLKGKSLGMIFQKNSTRTRVSFEVAMFRLGGHALCLNSQELQLARGETIADTARCLSRYLDAIMIRANNHDDVVELAANSSVPVINGLTEHFHPCQALADFLTIYEYKGDLKKVKLAYLGDANNNVTHSLLLAAAALGVEIHIACPVGYEPNPEILAIAKKKAAISGSKIKVGQDPAAACTDADAVYTDVWTSMGKESEQKEREQFLTPYQVNKEILGYAKTEVIFLHCLPANRGQEVTDMIMDGPNSVVFQQAENRMHVQKSVLCHLILGKKLSLPVKKSTSGHYRAVRAL